MHSFRAEPLNSKLKYGLKELQTSCYRMAQYIFQYLKLFRCGSDEYVMDRETDRIVFSNSVIIAGCLLVY